MTVLIIVGLQPSAGLPSIEDRPLSLFASAVPRKFTPNKIQFESLLDFFKDKYYRHTASPKSEMYSQNLKNTNKMTTFSALKTM